jgi:hypothetical protein
MKSQSLIAIGVILVLFCTSAKGSKSGKGAKDSSSKSGKGGKSSKGGVRRAQTSFGCNNGPSVKSIFCSSL